MTEDVWNAFDLDEFVSEAPVAKAKAAPEEYNNNDFIMEPAVEKVAIPIDGLDGKDGIDGTNGTDGLHGRDGLAGRDGLDGKLGHDGVSVVDTFVQDDDLFIRLSDGKLINAGDVRGPQGHQGLQGSSGGSSYRGGGVKKDMFVQDTQPNADYPHMWLQTNVNTNGDFSLWFNQC